MCISFGLILLNFAKDYFDNHKNDKSNCFKDRVVTTFRGDSGNSMNIKAKNLVVGDIILVKEGDLVPADCILIQG